MAHRQFGGDPAADAMADQIETLEPERVEQLEIVEDHVVDVITVAELVAAGAARMRGRDHPRGPGEAVVKRLQVGRDAVHVGEAVQIDERFAAAALDHRQLAAAQVQHGCAHCASSGVRSSSGNWRANNCAESALSRGATSSANSRMLLRVSASAMLPM